MRRDIVVHQRQVSLNDLLLESHIEWHGVALHEPDWSETSRSFALRVTSYDNHFRLHLIANAYWEGLSFELPPADGLGSHWKRWIDTALPSPHDISDWGGAPALTTTHYRVEARSVVVLFVLLTGDVAAG
jgi:glycogen operon protein